jgi:hypothetical protein
MSNFVDNNVSLPANKTDLVPIPAGGAATNYMASNDYNSLSQASQDIRTVIERTVSIMSFGADPTGTNDNSGAFTAAFAAMSNSGVLHLPGVSNTVDAVYKITNSVSVPANVTLAFDSSRISVTNGKTLTINGPINAPAEQIFSFNASPSATPVVIAGPVRVHPQWFGAVGDGETDSSAAIQWAITASQAGAISGGTPDGSASSARIFFPKGSYVVSSSISLGTAGGYVHLDGDDAIILASSNSVSPFTDLTYQMKIRGLIFVGGATALSITNNNVDSAMVKIENCEFQDQTVCSIFMDNNSESTLVTIDHCKFEHDTDTYETATLLTSGGGYINMTDCWVQGSWTTVFSLAANEYGTILHLTRMLGVPQNASGQWITMTGAAGLYAGIKCDGCRFGAEDPKTLVNWSAIPSLSSTGTEVPNYLYIINCDVYAGDTNPLISFYQLPNAFQFKGNSGNYGEVGFYFDSGIPETSRSQFQAQFEFDCDLFNSGIDIAGSDPEVVDNLFQPNPLAVPPAPINSDQLLAFLYSDTGYGRSVVVTNCTLSVTDYVNDFGNFIQQAGATSSGSWNWNVNWLTVLAALAAGPYTASWEVWVTEPVMAFWIVAGKLGSTLLTVGKNLVVVPFAIGENDAGLSEWATNTAYTAGEHVISTDSSSVFMAATSGTSAASGYGPVNGYSGEPPVVDGADGLTWVFVASKAMGIQFIGVPNATVISIGPSRVFSGHKRIATANTVAFATAAPNSGNWLIGDIVYNSAPLNNPNTVQPQAWVCLTAGNPGTWLALGGPALNIQADANGDLQLPGLNATGAQPASATNLQTYSQGFGSGYWVASGATIAGATDNAPDGSSTASKITGTGGNNEITLTAIASSAASYYTVSCWLRTHTGTNDNVTIGLYDDTGAAFLIQGACQVTTTWTRFVFTSANVATAAHELTSFIAVGASGVVEAWGFQVEATPYATPYIPTTSAPVTAAVAQVSALTGSFSTSLQVQDAVGISATVTLAKLSSTEGSLTVVGGIITAYVAPT